MAMTSLLPLSVRLEKIPATCNWIKRQAWKKLVTQVSEKHKLAQLGWSGPEAVLPVSTSMTQAVPWVV